MSRYETFAGAVVVGALLTAFFWPRPIIEQITHHASLRAQDEHKMYIAGQPCEDTSHKCTSKGGCLVVPNLEYAKKQFGTEFLTGFVCADACGRYDWCNPKTDTLVVRLSEIPPLQPHPTPINQQQKTQNQDAEMTKGAIPNIFSTLSTGVNRVLKGQNVFTGEPILGGARPLEAVP